MESIIDNKCEITNKNIIEENLNEIILRIDKVLKIFQVTKIISIDDSWIIENTSDIEQAISNILDENLKRNVERIRDNEDINDLEMLKSAVKSNSYSEKDNSILREFYEKYVESKKNTSEPTLKTLDKLIVTLQENCEGITVIRENKQLTATDIYKYSDTNNLFILDRNMSKSSGDKDSILDSILELKKNNNSNLILIYSNECRNDFDNHENKMKLLSDRNICDDEEQISIVYQLWGMNKTTDYNQLLEKFVENLYNCAFGKSIYNVLGVRNNALKDVFKAIKKEEIESYIPMFEGAYIEGDTILGGYLKIVDALYNKYMEQRYYNDIKESYKFLIDFEKSRIKTSTNIQKSQESQRKYAIYRLQHVKTQIKNILKNSERYRIACYSSNKLYKDISLGDIVVYTEPNENIKFGIVISRECDCVIRLDKINEKPKRGLEEYTVLLLEHREIDESLINKVEDKDYFNNYILPITYKSKVYSLKPTEKVRQFKTYILDLCSLNFNGQASINYTNDFKSYKSFHSENYYDSNFREMIQEEMRKYNNCEDIAKEDKIKILKNKLISYDYGIKFENESFCLERVCRLESKRTLLIIQNYIHSISLVGTDTPISNEII